MQIIHALVYSFAIKAYCQLKTKEHNKILLTMST